MNVRAAWLTLLLGLVFATAGGQLENAIGCRPELRD